MLSKFRIHISKSGRALLAICIAIASLIGSPAQASWLADECGAVATAKAAVLEPLMFAQDPVFTIHPASLGFSCQDLKQYASAHEMIQVSLLPLTATIAMVGGFREAALAQLAAAGVTTPVVLGITVLAATGYVTLYVLVKKDMEDCRRLEERQLREAVYREIEQRYGLKPSPRTRFEFKKR